MERTLQQSPGADRGMLARMPGVLVVARRTEATPLRGHRDYGFRERCVTCAFAQPHNRFAPLSNTPWRHSADGLEAARLWVTCGRTGAGCTSKPANFIRRRASISKIERNARVTSGAATGIPHGRTRPKARAICACRRETAQTKAASVQTARPRGRVRSTGCGGDGTRCKSYRRLSYGSLAAIHAGDERTQRSARTSRG